MTQTLEPLFPNGIVATLGDRRITVEDVRREITPLLPRVQQVPGNPEELRQRLYALQNSVIGELITRQLNIKEFHNQLEGEQPKQIAIIVGELQVRNVALLCTSQGIDTSKQNPVGQLQLGVLMAVAEFERALIKERTIAGLEVARRKGKRLGRPTLDPKIVSLILATAARVGRHVRAIAREIHTSPSSVCRVLALASQRPAPSPA